VDYPDRAEKEKLDRVDYRPDHTPVALGPKSSGTWWEENVTLPHFIGIGAQKAGTTWLYRNLMAHPQIWMPDFKEVHYFDKRANWSPNIVRRVLGKRRVDYKWRSRVRRLIRLHTIENFSVRNLSRDLVRHMRSSDDEWYASIFEPSNGRTTGEITPAYSVLDRDMVAYVHETLPDAKIIFFMRSPIERAWSQAVMSFDKAESGLANSVSRKRFMQRFDKRNNFRALTDYLRTLENWGSFYPEDRIFVGFLEDVHFFPEELLSRLYGFLGVDPSFEPPSLNEKVHSRSAGKIPTSLATHLAGAYREETARLAECFGGYASFWLYCAQRLIEDPPKGKTLAYPLWESALWEDWEGSSEIAVRSGPLSWVRAAP
jgi:hypothetical protein